MNNKSRQMKKIGINRLYTFLLCVCIIMIIFALMETRAVNLSLAKERNSINKQLFVIKQLDNFTQGSEYLTEQVKRYVVTREKKYLDNYFYEINDKKQVEKAYLLLKNEKFTEEQFLLLDGCRDIFNALMKIEIHSIKLVTTAEEIPSEILPEQINRWVLDASELKMPNDEKIKSAIKYIFGIDYENGLSKMREFSVKFSEATNMRFESEFAETSAKTKTLLKTQNGLIFLIALMFLAVFLILYKLIINPIEKYIVQLNLDEPLSNAKAKELDRLAVAFNFVNSELKDASKKLVLQNKLLQKLSETDYLTGLKNRLVLDKYLKDLINSQNVTKLSLLMADIDDFKTVNDNYGHNVGDLVLKKVAECLIAAENLYGGFAARYGGEEFVLILPELTETEADKAALDILSKIRNMSVTYSDNEKIGFTISIGGEFFSKTKNNISADNLMKHADIALYIAKENGKNRYVKFSDKK
ncbi:MAG: GGDEF domain-containing protein [Clostridia bacterium]